MFVARAPVDHVEWLAMVMALCLRVPGRSRIDSCDIVAAIAVARQ